MKRKLIRRNKKKYSFKVELSKCLQLVMGQVAEKMRLPASVMTGHASHLSSDEEIDRWFKTLWEDK